jgi:hypothetical protein
MMHGQTNIELYLLFVWVRNLVTHYKEKKHKLWVLRLLEKRVRGCYGEYLGLGGNERKLEKIT